MPHIIFPLPPLPASILPFYQSFERALSEGPAHISSVLVTPTVTVISPSYLSVKLEIITYVGNAPIEYALKGQTWDVPNGVLLRLKDLALSPFPRRSFWYRHADQAGYCWFIADDQIRFCHPSMPVAGVRRSALPLLVEQEAVPLSHSALLASSASETSDKETS